MLPFTLSIDNVLKENSESYYNDTTLFLSRDLASDRQDSKSVNELHAQSDRRSNDDQRIVKSQQNLKQSLSFLITKFLRACELPRTHQMRKDDLGLDLVTLRSS